MPEELSQEEKDLDAAAEAAYHVTRSYPIVELSNEEKDLRDALRAIFE